MIISYEHEFIYLRTRKTGSTSLEIALSSICGPNDVITSVCERDERLRVELGGKSPQNTQTRNGVAPYNHMTAAEAKVFAGEEVWERFVKFTVERDPLEKVVSLYFHRYKSEPRPTLDSFIDSGEALDAWNLPIYAIAERIEVDIIGNYRYLPQFITDIERAGIVPCLPVLGAAKSQFRIDQRPAADILSPDQKSRVLEGFRGEPDFGDEVCIRFNKGVPVAY